MPISSENEILSADKRDAKAIYHLILRCSEKFILPVLSLEGRKNYLKSHSLDCIENYLRDFDYYVIKNNAEEIIAVTGIRNHSHLYHLHVNVENQGCGLGKTLWEYVKSIKENDIESMTVNSSPYAVKFYEKLGFKLLSHEEKWGVKYSPMIYHF